MAEQVWEFQFTVVQAAETREQALQATLEYLAEMADKSELEPTSERLLEEGEYE